MKKIKFVITLFLFSVFNSTLYADVPYYLDFKYILNESIAGKKAQENLKKKLENGFKNISKDEKKIKDEEKKLIKQKKLITEEEYRKKVSELRQSVTELQKKRKNLLDKVAKERSQARVELLKALNPIIQDYMNKNRIRMVLDKKDLILADEKLEITEQIMSVLNKKLTSIKLNWLFNASS